MPPSLVLEVLRITEEEMDLRDATREAEQARPATPRDEHANTAAVLELAQMELAERTADVIDEIHGLPDGSSEFAREIEQLTAARNAMLDAEIELAVPSTGPLAIAAETEAIEHLLRSRRVKGGGGGGGSDPGSGGPRKGQTDASALALVGRSQDASGVVVEREVEAVTGNAGRPVPAELRDGLDRFFEELGSE